MEEEHKLQEEIEGAFDKEGSTALDSAYYEAGNGLFRGLGKPYSKVHETEYGRHFLLTPEEIRSALSSRKV